ncbi:hypothetical protein HK414_23240 [Ramlibacter terrae]|uniref:TniQ domain-containing protein n=1 Tax=Ramlibacter terrae TaxID=2732511 RepID=A0ABX6P6V3_9BURK|nr:hypothetical protein HK414_23240 [Ramlibacter terrae]
MLTLAYYVPFMPAEALRLCRDPRNEGEVRGLAMSFRPGSHALRKVHKPLRFCPACVMRDVRHEGEAHWRRAHQLDHVSACWEHRLRLSEWDQSENTPRLPHELEVTRSSGSIGDDEAWFASVSKQLLDGSHEASSVRKRSNIYRVRATRLGYSESTSGMVSCITNALQERFGSRLLNSVFGGHDVPCVAATVRRVIGTSAAQSAHPAAHLLCIEVLFGDLGIFFSGVFGTKGNQLWKAQREDAKERSSGISSGQTGIHRAIFMQAVKTYGPSAMQRLSVEHPVCHAWILHNDRRWAASLIRAAEQAQWNSLHPAG